MFGHHDPLAKKLRELGRSSSAQVIAADRSTMSVTTGPSEVMANTQIIWNLQLRVMPADSPPFEVAIRQALPQMRTPRPGESLTVLYDPADHSKVVVDDSPEATAANVDALLASQLSAEQAAAVTATWGMSTHELIAGALADPAGFSSRMRQQAQSAQQAAMQQAEATMDQAAAYLAAAQPTRPPAAAEDPLDRLARLADLRDRGALTEEEFQAQKELILIPPEA